MYISQFYNNCLCDLLLSGLHTCMLAVQWIIPYLNFVRPLDLNVSLRLFCLGGKKCLACDNRIYHDKWSITPEVAEARWAHKQAKDRELDEVIDFLK